MMNMRTLTREELKTLMEWRDGLCLQAGWNAEWGAARRGVFDTAAGKG